MSEENQTDKSFFHAMVWKKDWNVRTFYITSDKWPNIKILNINTAYVFLLAQSIDFGLMIVSEQH